MGAGQEELGRLVEPVDGDRVDQLHGVHLWDHLLVEVQRYGQGEERAEKSGGVSEWWKGGRCATTMTMIFGLHGDLELSIGNLF